MSDQRLNSVIQTLAAAAAVLALLYGIGSYFVGLSQTQAQARLQAHLTAWQVVDVARGQSADGGRTEALEALNKDGVRLAGLTAPKAHLECIKLDKANLLSADLNQADLYEASLRGGTDLRNADLPGATLEWADLDHAKFQGTELQFADLAHANLRGAYLYMAKLQRANLYNANLSGANLQGASLDGADWRKAIGATAAQLAQASSLQGTIMPSGLVHQRNAVSLMHTPIIKSGVLITCP